MILQRDYEAILKEHFDIEHTETRKIVLAVNEEDKNTVLTALTSKLYDNIVNKVDDIDYGTIPHTKGDITKLENYDKLVDCIGLMEGILKEFKQDLAPINTIKDSLNYLIQDKDLYEKAFRHNVEMPIVMYSTIALSIVSSTSFLITSCVEYIKSPNQEDFKIVLDKVALAKTKQNLLFRNLDRFNDACAKGQIETSLKYIVDSNMKGLTGIEPTLIVGGVALVGLILNIIPIMRELIFFFYYSRTRVSDYFEVQADLLQMNAYNIQSNQTMNKKEREAIAKNQLKIVSVFRNISNKFSIEAKQSEQKTTKAIANDSKQYKTSDLLDTVPDSATSVLF